MALRNRKPWMNVYPLGGREIKIHDSGARINLTKELSDYCDRSWEPKAEKGWKSSWIAFASQAKFNSDGIVLKAGAVPFSVVDGINKAIREGKSFAPEQGYNPSLSVGFLTATEDAKVIFMRRSPNVHCPNILIHEPCGYMTSLTFAPREECDHERHFGDKRLFDIADQLNFRKREIAEIFGLEPSTVSYRPSQDFLAAGWMTTEMYFSTLGKIDLPESKLTKPEGQDIFFVPFEDLKSLILNQGRLSRVSPKNYGPDNPQEIPLIDESLAGLIWGYEGLTGEKLDIPDTLDRLNGEGMNIRVYDTSPGTEYKFLNPS